ncbi:MAG: hypothetical protein FD146_2250 [Anaerolineaceae bacterium]|nr:MAG: hypothetical protein FD146_2250 [Anaerolineaceae bacterium]
MKKLLIAFLLIAVAALAACGGESTPVVTGPQDASGAPAGDANPPADNSSAGPAALPADPQAVTFQAADGQELHGYYYPAAVNPAPLVVLMHWVRGDMSDWYEIALWLQNRGQANPFTNPSVYLPNELWWEPSWFPPVPEGQSYGVFIFSFRGCAPYKAGCAGWTPDIWLLDAQAAMQTAVTLEGVDPPAKIVAIGSSVGADGAPDACAWLNGQTPGACQGALSLSPGSYMGIAYPVVVQQLGASQPPVAAWCVADETEFGICESAEISGNPAYRDFLIPTGQHGNMLLRPNLTPLPMQIILDFLAETVGP